VFWAPFVPFFDSRMVGRRRRSRRTYRLGYESLCREVSDSIT
jgi:hypothetical protein